MWLSKILGEIYHNGDVEKCQWDAIVNWVPFLEMKAPKMSSSESPSPAAPLGLCGEGAELGWG